MWIVAVIVLVLIAIRRSEAIEVDNYSKGAQVLHVERARGCHPNLIGFLNWWQLHGPFDIMVAPDGGVRTDAAKQASYCAHGTSNACTLESTPHGRACALDVWPVGFNPAVDLSLQPDILQKFKDIGEAGEAFGLKSGMRFRIGPSGTPDYPHLEIDDWRQMPFPAIYA